MCVCARESINAYIYIYFFFFKFIYIYVCTYMYVCVYVYIYPIVPLSCERCNAVWPLTVPACRNTLTCERASERANDRPAECNRLMRANMPAFRLASPIIGECSFLVVIIRVIDSVGAIALRTMRLELTLTAHAVTAGRIWGPDPASRSGNQLSLRFLVRLSAWASHAADMQNLLAGIRIQSRPRNASYYRSIDRSADSAWQGP